MSEISYYTQFDINNRNTFFDACIESTDTALKNPEVIHHLGDRALVLREINSRLFLPNIVNNLVSIPASKLSTEDSAFLPLFTNDLKRPKLRLDRTIFEPTPLVLAMIEGSIKNTWPEQSDKKTRREIRGILRDGHKSHKQTVASLFDGKKKEDKNKGRSTEVIAQVFSEGGLIYEDTEIFGYSRPILITAPVDSEVVTTGGLASIIGHEVVHIDNTHKSYQYSDDATQITDELEAYHVSTVIGEVYKDSLTEQELEDFKISKLIDMARLRYANPDDPFISTPKLTKLMVHYGAIAISTKDV
jgi:hypothetical protein